MNNYNELINKIKPRIKRLEGFRANPYNDTKGIRTWLYGLNVDDTQKGGHLFSQKEIRFIIEHLDDIPAVGEYMLDNCLNEIVNYLEIGLHMEYYLLLDRLPENVQIVLIDMAYNMGIDDLLKFKKMFKAIKDKDWNNAYQECLDSKYGRDRATAKRAKENADMLLGVKGE